MFITQNVNYRRGIHELTHRHRRLLQLCPQVGDFGLKDGDLIYRSEKSLSRNNGDCLALGAIGAQLVTQLFAHSKSRLPRSSLTFSVVILPSWAVVS
jgi:hypothetical protein